MSNIAILGAGQIGTLIACDLAKDKDYQHQITILDHNKENLTKVDQKTFCKSLCCELTNQQELAEAIDDADLVIGALPGPIGMSVLKSVIQSQKPYVDISFMPEDPRVLDDLAKEAGIPVLFDFGVAPGISNILAAHCARQMKNVRQIKIFGGALPIVRRPPWEYAAPLSPLHILEVYTRPVRIKINGEITTREPLTGLETIDFGQVGSLEAFYTDGLRSLISTVDCPFMEEKTLRYPGYATRIKLLRDSGFLNKNAIDLNGVNVAPMDVTLALLKKAWKMSSMEDEFTILRVLAIDGENNPFNRITWELLDYTDRKNHDTSVSRTTGFPVVIAANSLLDGSLKLPPGVHPPEIVASNDSFFAKLLDGLRARGVVINKK